MRTLTATFRSAADASTAVEALRDAGVQEPDITSDTAENGETVVEARVDDGLVDAAAAILGKRSAETVESEADDSLPVVDEPNVAGHPDGPRPVITPVAPNR